MNQGEKEAGDGEKYCHISFYKSIIFSVSI